MNSLDTNNHGIPFLKMHGLGNDFVIVDARAVRDPVTRELARSVGHRYFGVGFDQLAVLKTSEEADVDVEFWNSDGSKAGACGNASRCIGRLLMEETGRRSATIKTERGLLQVAGLEDGRISINMGQPQLIWQEIPLAKDVDLLDLPIDGSPGAVGMGNPHCVFVVEDAEAVDLPRLGVEFEYHPLFPERTNVEFIQVIDRRTIRMRVWERGGMITLACGSGACASLVVAHRKGLVDRKAELRLDGGNLEIDWRDNGVWMTGTATLVYSGVLAPEFLDAVK
ncbi:MAG: diaminopimelate epimerase [Rhodobacteraceae bacterium]|nr:diaminopimelate epimerase [Paracoccaceae bacterium]